MMYKRSFSRILSTIIALTLMIGIFAVGGTAADAAGLTTTVTIAKVTRCYKDAAAFLEQCNTYRQSNGLKTWTMDKDTLEAAMVRAAELSIYIADNRPDGSDGLQSVTGSVRSQYTAYGVLNLNSHFSEMKTDREKNDILLSTQTTAAGVGVVTVNGTKFLVLFTTNKTATKVDSSVLTQSNTTIDQKVSISTSNLGEVSMPFTNGQNLFCGSSIQAYLKVKNKTHTGMYVLLTPDNMTVKVSDESVMKRSGDRVYAIAPGTATVSIYLADAGYIGASCQFKAVARSFSDCTFSSIPDQYYTGSPIRPNVTVKNASGQILSLGTDYAVSYNNNVEVGTATVLISGMGSYAGETKRVYFNILKSGSTDTTTFTVSVSTTLSTLSLGQSTVITVTPSGGTAPVKYTYTYAEYGTTNWITLSSNSTSNKYTFKPSAAKKYYLRATATDAKNRTASQTAVVKVNSSFTCTAKLSMTKTVVNNAVTVTGTYSGGTSPYTYAFYVLKPSGSSYTTLRDFSATDHITYTPTAAGTYQFTVKCKNGSGDVVSDVKSLTVTSNDLQNNSSVSNTNITLGQSVKLNGAASGGKGPYEFAYFYKADSDTSWTLKKKYSATASVTIQPAKSGTYSLCVRARDSLGKVEKKYFEVTVKSALVNSSKLSSSKIYKGASVSVNCAASGGSGGYQFAVYYKRKSVTNWTLARKYGTGTFVSITPKYSGDYDVRVKAKDSNGKITNKDLTVNVGPELSNTSKVSATSITKGKSVTVTCSATGGKPSYVYAVYYKQTSQSTWTKARDYENGTSVTVTPKKATTYTIRVKAKDSAGVIVNKEFTVTVK